ncbi:hypothetical protein JCM30237_08240 [Halolamina litorea]|uniref:TIGR04206 family protein n=1 Tax=Halolamina litorea TaxID=1515593 RepID=A0ABD6BQJ2_9EURY|nr:hypothetical protein [Halolamina litorea]
MSERSERIRPKLLAGVLVVIVVATYVEFVWLGSPTVYDVALWLLVVPLLLSFAVSGVEDHRLYRPLLSAAIAAIGVLQYLDGEWRILAAAFVLSGLFGLFGELRDRGGSGT